MPTTISSFELPVIQQDPSVSTSSVAFEGNHISRIITINNTGKSAKTNLPFMILVDHQSWVMNYDTGFLLNSLRIYDNSGNRLEHYVEADNTTYCSIFFKHSVGAGATVTVTMRYGNGALPDLRSITGVFGAIMNDSRMTLHLKANETARTWTGGNGMPTQPVWVDTKNNATRFYCDETDPFNVPNLYTNQQNGQPLLNFNGGSYYRSSIVNNNLMKSASEHTVFALINPFSVASSSGMFRRQGWNYVSNQAGFFPDLYLNSLWHDGTSSKWINHHDGGTTGANTGITANVTQLVNSTWKQNATWATYRNGGLVASRASANTPIQSYSKNGVNFVNTPNLCIGGYNPAYLGAVTEKSMGLIGDIIEFNYQLTASERVLVERYYDCKYNYSGSTDRAVVTMSANTVTIPTTTNFEQFGLWRWIYNCKLENNLTKENVNLKLQKILSKRLNSGSVLENAQWSGAGAIVNNSLINNNRYARRLTLSTATQLMTLTTTKTNSGVNLNQLSWFLIRNQYNNTINTIQVTTSDYIQFTIYIADVTLLNTTSSYIKLYDLAITSSWYYPLNLNLNTLVNGTNIIKFRISQGQVTGTPTLAIIEKIDFDFKSISGSPILDVTNIEIVADYSRFNNQVSTLWNKITEDNFATNYLQKINTINTLLPAKQEEEYIEYDCQTELGIFLNSQFKDINGFTGMSMLWNQTTYTSMFTTIQWNCNFYYIFIYQILLLNFPNYKIAISNNLIIPTAEYTGTTQYNKQYFGFNSTDKIGTVLGELLKAVGGYIYYNSVTDKITVDNVIQLNIKPVIDATRATVKELSKVVSVTKQTNSSAYNKITSSSEISIFDGVLSVVPPPPIIGKELQIPVPIPAVFNNILGKTIIQELSGLDQFAKLQSAYNYRVYTDSWYLSSFSSKPTTDSTVYTRGSIFPTSAKISAGKLFLELANWGSQVLLHAIDIKMNSLTYIENNNLNGVQVSPTVMVGSGSSELAIMPHVASINTNTSTNTHALSAINNAILANTSLTKTSIVNTYYSPIIQIGTKVSYVNADNELIIGYVYDIKTYGDTDVGQEIGIVHL